MTKCPVCDKSLERKPDGTLPSHSTAGGERPCAGSEQHPVAIAIWMAEFLPDSEFKPDP